MAHTTNPLLRGLQYFRKGEASADGHSEISARDREWEYAYRQRWQHDKIVRSTHGVNCTGSCSWKVYVKDGIITWSPNRRTTPRTAPTCRSTNLAAALGRLVFLVHLLTDPRQISLRSRRAGRYVPRSQEGDGRPGGRLGLYRGRPRRRSATRWRGARAGSCAPRGRRFRRSCLRPTSIPSRSTGRTGL